MKLRRSEIEPVDSCRSRILKSMSCQLAPAHREEISGIIACPIVKVSRPTVKGDKHVLSRNRSDGGRANELGVVTIHGLQLVAFLEEVALWVGWGLNKCK